VIYALASGQFLARALSQSRDTVPVGSLLVAHAADVLDPGNLTLNALQIAYGGKNITGADQLAPLLSLAGVRLDVPKYSSDDYGTVSTSAPPSAITQDFHDDQLGGIIGQDNVDFLEALKVLWSTNVAQLGYLTDYQLGRVQLLLDAGIIVVPASPAYLGNLGYATELRTVPPQFVAAWDKVVAIFKSAVDAYNAKNFATAVSEAKAAALRADLWNDVYAAVEFAHELPAEAVKGAVDVGGQVAGALGWKNILLLGGLALLILLGPALLGAVASRTVRSA
jgi:hypothetical protein